MKQPRERKNVVPLAKKRLIKTNRGTAGVGKVGASHKEQTNIITKKGDQNMETTTGFKTFEMKNVSEDVLRFIKFSLDTTFENIKKLQEFNDKIVKDMIQTNKQIQADSEKILDEWAGNGKQALDEYRKAVQNGFKKVEEMIQPAK
jgi:hypothetical protein